MKKYNINKDFFEKIDNEEKSYWLGFLYADGYIAKSLHAIEVSLAAKDIHHLEKFKQSISSEHPIQNRQVELKGNVYDVCRITLGCTKMAKDLNSLGCTPKKSFTVSYPEFLIGDELERHFIRGFFDGDGSISVPHGMSRKISITCGNEDMIIKLKERIETLSQGSMYIAKDRNCFVLKSSKKKDMKKVLDFLYKDSTIYLDRKFYLYTNYFDYVLPS